MEKNLGKKYIISLMEPPIRCFTCNRTLGHLWRPYFELLANDVPCREACERLGIKKRYCCLSLMLTTPSDSYLYMPPPPSSNAKYYFQSQQSKDEDGPPKKLLCR